MTPLEKFVIQHIQYQEKLKCKIKDWNEFHMGIIEILKYSGLEHTPFYVALYYHCFIMDKAMDGHYSYPECKREDVL